MYRLHKAMLGDIIKYRLMDDKKRGDPSLYQLLRQRRII